MPRILDYNGRDADRTVTVAEIADALAIPAGTVASRLRRAREAFQLAVKQQRVREITATTIGDLRAYQGAFARMLDSSHRAIIGNRAKIEQDKELFDIMSEL